MKNAPKVTTVYRLAIAAFVLHVIGVGIIAFTAYRLTRP